MKREEKSKQRSGQVTGRGGEIILYKAKDGRSSLDVRLEQDTVWLTQAQMASLFETERSVVTKHINNILRSNELARECQRSVKVYHPWSLQSVPP